MSFISQAYLLVFWILGFLFLWRIPFLRKEDLLDIPPGGISIIIPARNEGKKLARLLRSLSEQTLKPREIIVVDDHSEDGTAEVGERAGCVIIPSSDLPEGWAGKPWGCWQGAQQAQGEIFIFLDADTFLDPDGLQKIVATFFKKRGLLTIQPYHQMEKVLERLSAIFNIIVLAGMNAFTPWGARFKPMGAFGPCNVCFGEDYFAIGGHQKVRGEVLESLGLGKEFSRANHGVHCYGGKGTISFRMYPEGIRSMMEGFAKGFATGARATSLGTMLMVVCWITGGVGVTRYLLQSAVSGEFANLIWLLIINFLYVFQIHWMLSRIGNFGFLTAILYPIPLLFFIFVFALSLMRIFFFGEVRWKGRVVRTTDKKR
jgi:4,4'-diaponeurosporenoate glycosyltransferase